MAIRSGNETAPGPAPKNNRGGPLWTRPGIASAKRTAPRYPRIVPPASLPKGPKPPRPRAPATAENRWNPLDPAES